jgi:hypothetical protein
MMTTSQQKIIDLLQTKTAELNHRIPNFKMDQIQYNSEASQMVIRNGVSDPFNLNELYLDISITDGPPGPMGIQGKPGGLGEKGLVGKSGIQGPQGYWI